MSTELGAAPALSSPDTHILNETIPAAILRASENISDEEFAVRYEINRTLQEIKERRWKRIALQFPDEMLQDSTRVFQMLARGLKSEQHVNAGNPIAQPREEADGVVDNLITHRVSSLHMDDGKRSVRLTILADTSYGSCCIDEIAAEHVDAEVVVHYGRACLSPTTRLPVIHVFTKQSVNIDSVISTFLKTFSDHSEKIIVTADVPYASQIEILCERLVAEGYLNIFPASITHDPASAVPNRIVPETVKKNRSALKDWQLFHLSEPPTSLLLTLSSRVAAVHIYPTDRTVSGGHPKSLLPFTSVILRRRYALITSLSTVSIWGILINTLSVKNYLHMVDHVKKQIAVAGKKSYLFVVGKLNAAKVANFGEIGGWVVIGCWESSLIDSKDFYKPVITPFELALTLQRDDHRLWTGEWRGDFQSILDKADLRQGYGIDTHGEEGADHGADHKGTQEGDVEKSYDFEEESAPPEFDLRSGRYISNTRPTHARQAGIIDSARGEEKFQSGALMKRLKGDVVAINGVPSPAAEFLRSQRTWTGLGSDLEIAYDEAEGPKGSAIEEGRQGIARGYATGGSERT